MKPKFNPSTLAKLELRGFKQFVASGLLSFGVFFAQDAASELPKFASKPEFVGVVEELSVSPALFSTQSFEWNDVERQRVVPAKLYIPVGPLKTGEVPLVVFSHGIGGSKESYRYLGSYFAAHGYASLHVQHVGSDRQIWRGNPFSIVTRLTDAAQEGEALNRVNDVKFALNQLLAEPIGSAIDASRLVTAGHSYGANTTMLLAGARVNVKGMPTSVKDPRFSAAILISAPPFYGMGDPQKILSDIDIPSLHITATADDINIPGYNSGVADRLALYSAIGATTHAAKVLAVFKDGSHSIFTDRKGTGGVALNPKVKVATRQLAVAFLDCLQAADQCFLEQWTDQNKELLAQFERNGFHGLNSAINVSQ